jgi:RND superfamily putative drug exporter
VLLRIAGFAVRRRRLVLTLAVAFVVLSGALGAGVVKRLSGGGFDNPGAPSVRASAVLAQRFHSGAPNFVLMATAPPGTNVDGPQVASAGVALTERLAATPHVLSALSYWTVGHLAALRSNDHRRALVVVRLAGTDDQVTKRARALASLYRDGFGPLSLRASGQGVIFAAVSDRIQRDLSRAELVAFPVTFILLIFVFGGLVAAALPLIIGALAIIGTLLVLRVISSFTDVSVYALNLTTGMGLGLGIDYALFVVSRYREEVAAGAAPQDAVLTATRTAGRTVAFSALTVALSLSALLVFPLFFLRSFAYAGIAVVAIAAVGALVVLPAVLAALGPRVDSLRLLRRRPLSVGSPRWRWLAETVMRRPVVYGLAVLVVLLVLGSPFLGARFGLPDDRVLPASAAVQQTSQVLRTDFTGQSADPVSVVSTNATAPTAVAAYAERLGAVPGVSSVQLRAADTRGFWIQLVSQDEAYSAAGRSLIARVRAVPAPAPVLIGGSSAQLVDTEHSLGARLPVAAGIIAAAMLVVLWLFTGSIVVPAKAIVLNLLSLSATFGAMVFVFQQGHLGWLVGHPIVTGTLDTTTPILMFCVAFGLSMDYEVFLLSRIKESYEATADNTAAVALGVERTGRLITAAAVLIAVVFLTFVSSGITFIKLFGLGMALAVLVDATLVRGVLVPAFMRLAGRWNWWAPAPLRAAHARLRPREAAALG